MSSKKDIPNEVAMQQAWRFRLWGSGRLLTSQGKTIEIVEAGRLNNGAGPDFSDALIKVDDDLWAGAVEIHRHASDWHRHGHDKDRAYDSVVLHVVGDDDCRIERSDGSEILQTVMEIDDGFAEMFNSLLHSTSFVLPMCGAALGTIASIFKTDWLTALAFERLHRKAADVKRLLTAEKGDWMQTVYVTLARGLGFGANADNMERLARCTPFRILLKHSDSRDTVEAILFGQAGLLNISTPSDDYERQLVSEYRFYAIKYGLRPIERPVWHLGSRSTVNTPYRRIAVLAALVCSRNIDLARLLSPATDIQAMMDYTDVELSDYWTHRHAFGRSVSKRMCALGKESRELLIINVLAPLVYARALETNSDELFEKAVALWENLPGEKNAITRGFAAHNVKADDAFTSQALIQLHREYCERRRCPDCRLGHRLLSSFVRTGSKLQ